MLVFDAETVLVAQLEPSTPYLSEPVVCERSVAQLTVAKVVTTSVRYGSRVSCCAPPACADGASVSCVTTPMLAMARQSAAIRARTERAFMAVFDSLLPGVRSGTSPRVRTGRP